MGVGDPGLPSDAPVTRFTLALRELRKRSGPIYRDLARAHPSASSVMPADSGGELPSLDLALAHLQACGEAPERWRARWNASRLQGEPVR
jgi:hypothetical protein